MNHKKNFIESMEENTPSQYNDITMMDDVASFQENQARNNSSSSFPILSNKSPIIDDERSKSRFGTFFFFDYLFCL